MPRERLKFKPPVSRARKRASKLVTKRNALAGIIRLVERGLLPAQKAKILKNGEKPKIKSRITKKKKAA